MESKIIEEEEEKYLKKMMKNLFIEKEKKAEERRKAKKQTKPTAFTDGGTKSFDADERRVLKIHTFSKYIHMKGY